MSYKPYYTSQDIISAVKRKIVVPISQSTMLESDILKFATEEMYTSQVPSVLQYHSEYFVQRISTPIIPGVSRYPVPERAIGMKLRDLYITDQAGNYTELTQIDADNKAEFQDNWNVGSTVFYFEGNDVIIPDTPTPTGSSLDFYVFLRPNVLVDNSRACIVQSFSKKVVVSSPVMGDSITVTLNTQGVSPLAYSLSAVAGAPSSGEFQIGGTDAATAANMVSALIALGLSATSSSNVVRISHSKIDFSVVGVSPTLVADEDTLDISFDQLPTTWQNPETLVQESLFSVGSTVDLLQTKPGHRTHCLDVTLVNISGTIGTFNVSDLTVYLGSAPGVNPGLANIVVGDYMCLAQESIIPQIPPDLHSTLSERTAARVLSALGDTEGFALVNAKIQSNEQAQGTMLSNRAEGAPRKVLARNSLLRSFKRW